MTRIKIKNEECTWRSTYTLYGFPIYVTECGTTRLNYIAGYDIYCNNCGRKIKVITEGDKHNGR